MIYIVMADGEGKRWNNYLGIPKHLIMINGETLLGRTTRLLQEHNIDYIITGSDERYKQYGEVIPQSHRDCEIDRFENTKDKEICYLYGDVYYTDEALKTIINTPTDEILFFGSDYEIFAIKIKDKKLFIKHKNRVKKLYMRGKIDRCIGWEVYKSINNIPLNDYAITDRYYMINDDTDDIDYPEDYEKFINKIQGGHNMIKCEVIKKFGFSRFNELEHLERKTIDLTDTLLVGDTFECTKEIADYLTGNNPINEIVVKVIEVEPEPIKVVETDEAKDIAINFYTAEEVKPKKSKKKKK